MMKKSKRLAALASALVLTGVLVGGSVAVNGDQNDPLVTQSYLDRVAIPKVVGQVDEKMAVRQKALDQSFADQVAKYKAEMQGSMGGQGGQASASYTLVTVQKGQTMSLEVGCELMLRVGSAAVSAGSGPALVDMTTGDTLNSGAGMVKNHLYMSTIPDRVLKPTADTVKLLVRGGYTVK